MAAFFYTEPESKHLALQLSLAACIGTAADFERSVRRHRSYAHKWESVGRQEAADEQREIADTLECGGMWLGEELP